MLPSDEPRPIPVHAGDPRDDPFKHWPHSDLLVQTADQEFVRRHHGPIAPLFDWPELRDLFEVYNGAAERARARGRRFGVHAVTAGFLALVVSAVAPLLGVLTTAVDPITSAETSSAPWLTPTLGAAAAFFAAASLLMGATQVLRGREKALWLANRFHAERVRQFHFQLILNNLPSALAACANRAGLDAWLRFRGDELDKFRHEYLAHSGETIHHLRRDEADDRPWAAPEWSAPGPLPPPSPAFDRFLKVMNAQRLGIQRRYAALKLKEGWHSPRTRARRAARLSDILILGVLLAILFSGVTALFGGHGDNGLGRALALAVGGACAAGAIALHVLDTGLQLGAEAERCTWYLAAVESLERRFDHADAAHKVDLLREMELLAYQEMRRFIVSVESARFVI